MQIRALEVSGLRSVRTARLSLENLTVLIGGNNAGKSTLLHALRLFFEAAPKISDDDFHKRDVDSIEITITFNNLTPNEIDEFGSAVHDGEITISRTISKEKEKNLSYSVRAKSYPPFSAIRAESNKTNQRSAFNEMAETLAGLTKAANAEQVLERMNAWEQANPDKLEFVNVRGFFGAPNVANGKLKKKTNLHFIPAVADVSEETSDPKRSPIIALLSDIARQIYENRKEMKDFIEKTQADFSSMVSPANFPQLGEISGRLTSTIQKYYSDSKLLADWQTQEGIKFSFPQPVIRVEDGGFLSGLENVGHGLQRAALFSVIEFLAQGNLDIQIDGYLEAQSDIILLIEEPEIYQHPLKQKLVGDAFRAVCQHFSKSTGIRFQVVFATHSEKFVDMANFHTARIVRREEVDGVATHRVAALTISDCSKYFADLLAREPMTNSAFVAKLHIFSREICEGFFARKIILVEGVTDRAVIEGAYRALKRDNISEGIVVIAVDGKTKMDKPFYIFNKLGIPAYAVFDSDINSNDKKVVANKILQKIAGIGEIVDFPSGVFDRFAAFSQSLEGYTKSMCGFAWQETFKTVAEELGLDVSDVCKTPQAVSSVVQALRVKGAEFKMFDEIIVKVDAMAVL